MTHKPAGLIGLLLALAACAPTINLQAHRNPSYAKPQSMAGALHEDVTKQLAGAQSGFYLLETGLQALSARLWLAQHATHTLDVQYYLFHGDSTGQLVAEALLAAADRGVRVRVLLDDIHTSNEEAEIAALDAHPNIEIRLFNPFRTRNGNMAVKAWQFVAEGDRLNRRMHNKAFIADNQIGITGGRNIGDEYFQASRELAFLDLDVAAAGGIVDALSHSFDAYWNSEAVVPAAVLHGKDDALHLTSLRGQLKQHRNTAMAGEYGRQLATEDPMPGLASGKTRWQVADADLIVDPPEKALGENDEVSKLLVGQLAGLWLDPKQSALIVSPYFVPGRIGMEYFSYWRSHGVQVDVLTNAYAASDVPLVHAGYANYRVPLLEIGVGLYELKPLPNRATTKRKKLPSGSSRASLHAKTFIFDRQHVFIGTFNFDPRSALLNTEMGLVIHSLELAQQVERIVRNAMSLDHSYRVQLLSEVTRDGIQKRLQWQGNDQGQLRTLDQEPETTYWQRSLLQMLQTLPFEEHL